MSRARFSQRRLEQACARIQADVERGRIPGAVLLVANTDEVLFERAFGVQDPKGEKPMALDSIFRIYSMTKPLVSAAAMMLVEEGRLLLSDPVEQHLPELAGLQVGVEARDAQGRAALALEPARQAMTVQDLLRHTSGLTYGIFGESLVKSAYRDAGVEGRNIDNAEVVRRLARLPLAYQPGTVWEYGRSTDVLGALLERVSGASLDVLLRNRIFAPLRMADTDFWMDEPRWPRLAEPFDTDPDSGAPVRLINLRRKPPLLSGGGGLASSAADYLAFARMLANGGSLDGVRLLSRKSVELMTSDHLAGLPLARSGANYLPGPGYGFGLGFAVRTADGGALTPGSVGEYNWSGLAGTYFWVDPRENFLAIWLMQAPEQRAHYRALVRNLVLGALE